MKWADLRQWQMGPLSEQARSYADKQRVLAQAGDDLRAGVDALVGVGRTVTAAQAALRQDAAETAKQEEKLGALSDVLSFAAHGVASIRSAVASAEAAAARNMLAIHPDGSIGYVGPMEVSKDDARRIRQAMKQLADRVAEILRAARDMVREIRSKLLALSMPGVAGALGAVAPIGKDSSLKLPPPGATAKEVAKWWSSLTPEQKEKLINEHPYEIGKLDGVDGTSRDKANRLVLDIELPKLEAEYEEYKKKAGLIIDPFEAATLKKLKERADAVRNIRTTLDRSDEDGMPRQLLGIDTSNPRVTAIVAQGNVDTAKHIGVIVPGMHTNVADNLDDYDYDASVMGANVRKHAHGEEVAMVSYLGYDAPQNVVEVASIKKANAGAKQLAGFFNGMHASREYGAGDAHVTAVTHSYGSTTGGKALTMIDEGAVDDLIQFGSPGSGVQDVSELKIPKGHAWVSATTRWQDMVQGIGDDGRFGKNPAKMPGYNHLSGDVGHGKGWFVPFRKHSSYFNEGSEALDDISKVVAGRGVPRSTR